MPPARPRGRLGVFRHRDFALFWTGGLLSNTGTWLQNVTAGVHIYVLTQSAVMVGLLSAATFLPILLFGLWGGVASDRIDRRRIVIVTHALAMVATAGLTILAVLGLVSPIVLIGNAFLVNTSWAFAKPALVTLLPTLVERDELVDATATNGLQYTLGQFLGPFLSAVILVIGTPALAYGVNTLTFLAPIIAMLLIRPAAGVASSAADASPWKALREGLGYVRHQPIVAALLLGVACTSAVPEAIRTLSPVFAVDVLSGTESVAGLLVGAQSGGAALALFAVPFLRRRVVDRHLILSGVASQAVGIVVLAAAPGLVMAMVGAFLSGVGFATVFTHLTARLLNVSADGMRGRVMSLHTVANLGLRPGTSLFAGLSASVIDPRFALGVFVVFAPLTLLALARGDAHSATYHDTQLQAVSGGAGDG